MEDRFYDYQHKLDIALVNRTQLLFVPILGSKIISDAAEIYDWPLVADEIGNRVLLYFRQMSERTLPLYAHNKKYWLMPKKVRSYKQFVEASLLLVLELDDTAFELTHWCPAPDRGFMPSDTFHNESISRSVSAKELGELILRHFDYTEKELHP